jgi:hypothetical protein
MSGTSAQIMDQAVQPATAGHHVHYERRRPEERTLYQLVQEHAETFFTQVEAPTAEQLQALLSQIIKRIIRLLTRKGYLIEEQGITYLAEADADLAMAPLQSAACTYRIAFGPQAGQKVLSLKTAPMRESKVTAKRCVSEHGFSLHGDVRCAAHQRNQLELHDTSGHCP